MFANTLSNEEINKIKVVDLDEFKNFIFMTFTFEIIYSFKMLFQVVIFEIQILNHSNKVT